MRTHYCDNKRHQPIALRWWHGACEAADRIQRSMRNLRVSQMCLQRSCQRRMRASGDEGLSCIGERREHPQQATRGASDWTRLRIHECRFNDAWISCSARAVASAAASPPQASAPVAAGSNVNGLRTRRSSGSVSARTRISQAGHLHSLSGPQGCAQLAQQRHCASEVILLPRRGSQIFQVHSSS